MQKLAIAVVLALTGAASAQYVDVLPRAATPLVVSTIYGGVPFSQLHAAGPLMSEGSVYVTTPSLPGSANHGRASFHWAVYPSWSLQLEECWVDCDFHGELTPTGGAALASVGNHDLVVDMYAAAPRKVLVDVDFAADLFGASQPTVWELDIGNDGVVDAQLGGGHVQVPLQLGVAAVPLRLRCSAAIGTPNPGLATSATMDGSVSIRITPDNDVAVQQLAAGCGIGSLEGVPDFASGGVKLTGVNTGSLAVLVLGAQAQPWSFASLFGACTVVPSLDVLLTFGQPLSLPIPASLRPLTFQAQVVHLSMATMGTDVAATQALQISAW